MWPSVDEFLTAWIGEDKPTDRDAIEMWLGFARDMVLEAVPSVEQRVDMGLLSETRLKFTVLSAVNRVFRNPSMIRSYQESMSTGGISGQGSTMFAGNRLGELYLTPDELATLRGTPRKGKAFGIRIGGPN